VTAAVTVPRRSGRFAGTSLAVLLVILGAGIGFAILLGLVRAQWRPLEAVDHGVAAWLNRAVAGHRPLVVPLTVVTTLGSSTVLWSLVGIGVLVLVLRRLPRLAVYLVVTGVGALILDPTIKTLVGRLRPVVATPVAHGQGNSFPSGHALGSIAVYGALLLVLLPGVPRRYRSALTGAVGGLVVAIGFTRLALGVHYLSDVLGAWLLGVAWLGATGHAFEVWRRRTGRRSSRPLDEGLEPEAAADLRSAVPEHEDAPHVVRAAAGLVVGWVLVFGLLVGLGLLVRRAPDNVLGDRAVPQWLAAHRTGPRNGLSYVFSEAGNTHWILAVGVVAGAVTLAVLRSWRPVVFLLVTMFGELFLFLASDAVVRRERPDVPQLDSGLPTSSFPSGHVAATICLYAGIALLVMPRTTRWWRWLFPAAAVLMPALVAVARLYRGEHHPTDLLGSVLLAACWMTAVVLAVRPLPGAAATVAPPAERRPGPPDRGYADGR
jgi:undecaprenyl-diphosphatase